MEVGFLNYYGAVLNVAQQRASLVANNIANADTPGFKAQDVPFDAAMNAQLAAMPSADVPAGSVSDWGLSDALSVAYRADATVALDGNDVSLDQERLEAAENGERMTGAATFLHQSTSDLLTALRPNPSGT